MSESHERMMAVFDLDPTKFMDEYSDLIRRRFAFSFLFLFAGLHFVGNVM